MQSSKVMLGQTPNHRMLNSAILCSIIFLVHFLKTEDETYGITTSCLPVHLFVPHNKF
jgi:hypothetical protein